MNFRNIFIYTKKWFCLTLFEKIKITCYINTYTLLKKYISNYLNVLSVFN